MALNDIQADMNAKRYEIAKEKVDVFLKTWESFSSGPDSCSGTGIRDIVVKFSKMPGGINARTVEPNGATNLIQPVQIETNATPR
jgi:alkanesulfonate monooxygenase SsuD/methylene tetrahydromethanopterin reductase-like flavin-dependent oxidoreductase (luciferase family)